VQEAAMIAEMLHTKPLIQQTASKETVISDLATAECIHFACQLAWKNSAVVLSPGTMVESQSNSKRYYPNGNNEVEQDDESNEMNSSSMEIPLSDYTLNAAEINNMRIAAKLVVFNTNSSSDQISGSAVAKFTNSWLIAGAGSVLISLWPVPELASKILLRAFYSSLLQGSKVSNALTEAMQTVQHTKHFNNPVNWGNLMIFIFLFVD
jgi:CHAT domain-containing protein